MNIISSNLNCSYTNIPWWRHQMETFSALLALCAGNSPVNGEFPAQRPVTRSFDVFFYLRLNKPLGQQSWGWWFETPSRPLWRHLLHQTQHDMMMSWHGNFFAHQYWPFWGETGRFPSQRAGNGDLCFWFFVSSNILLNKQLSCWWFKMPWRPCDVTMNISCWLVNGLLFDHDRAAESDAVFRRYRVYHRDNSGVSNSVAY